MLISIGQVFQRHKLVGSLQGDSGLRNLTVCTTAAKYSGCPIEQTKKTEPVIEQPVLEHQVEALPPEQPVLAPVATVPSANASEWYLLTRQLFSSLAEVPSLLLS